MNKQTLQEVAVYSLTLGIILLLSVGVVMLTNHENVRIEAKCQASGGQVLQSPGHISKCLLPAK